MNIETQRPPGAELIVSSPEPIGEPSFQNLRGLVADATPWAAPVVTAIMAAGPKVASPLPGVSSGRLHVPGLPLIPTSAPTASSEAEGAAGEGGSQRVSSAVARALEPLSPVRLHVEWEATSANVWIGLDSTADLHLPTLVEALSRWLDRAGARLRSVTCNGERCFADAASGTASKNAARDAVSRAPGRPSSIAVHVMLNEEK